MRWIPASRALSGVLFGVALAVLSDASLERIVVMGILVGALATGAGGLSRFLVSAVLSVAVLSALFVTWGDSAPSRFWQMSWMEPAAIVLMLGFAFLSRLRDRQPDHLQASHLVVLEIAGASAALLLAVYSSARGASGAPASAVGYLAPLGSTGNYSYLLENDYWINIVAKLSHAGVLSASVVGAKSFVGLTMVPVLAFARVVLSMPQTDHGGINADAQLVLRTYFLAMVMTPVVVVSVFSGLKRARQVVPVAAAWLLATVVLVSQEIGFASLGHLDIVVDLPLTVLALAAIVTSASLDPRPSARSCAAWMSAALLVFLSATAWLPLLPLGASAILVWFVVSLARQGWRRALTWTPWPLLELAALGLMEYALWRRFVPVLSQAEGIRHLLLDPVSGVFTNDTAQVLLLGLVVAVVGVRRGWSHDDEATGASFLTPLSWLLGYEAVVMLVEAWTAKAPAETTAQMGSFVLAVCLALGMAEASAILGTRQLRLPALVAASVVVLMATTVGQGMVYSAVAGRWPQGNKLPHWVSTVTSEVSTGARVFCLNTWQTGPDPTDWDPQTCSIYAATDAGRSQAALTAWLGVIDGTVPVSKIIGIFEHRGARRWVVVVFGPLDSSHLHDKADPFSKLLERSGLTFVAA